MKDIRVIMNPASARGRTARQWSQWGSVLKEHIGDYRLLTTTAPGEATLLARKALTSGADWLIAVGGDGTLNEVINGFFDEQGQHINPQACLSVLMCGTGGDFRRSLGLSGDPIEAIQALAERPIRSIDVGKAVLTGFDGAPKTHYFLNIASFGLGGEAAHRLNHSKLAARLGGKAGFMWATLETLARFKPKRVVLTIDGHMRLKAPIRQVVLANGSYQGGGMYMAPKADLCDGLLDLIILEDHGLLHSLQGFSKVYRGTHLEDPKIQFLQINTLKAEAQDQVMLELDGETPGVLPARFEVLPHVLLFKG